MWEEGMLRDLEQIVASCDLQRDRLDAWRWRGNPSGVYSVDSAYQQLLGDTLDQQIHRIFTTLWKQNIPLKVRFFLWRLFLNRLPTLDNLKKKNVRVSSNSWLCPLCNQVEETTTHVFFSCRVAESVWKTIYSRGSLATVLPFFPRENFWQKPCTAGSMWNSIWCFVKCHIWNFRNENIFVGSNLIWRNSRITLCLLVGHGLNKVPKHFLLFGLVYEYCCAYTVLDGDSFYASLVRGDWWNIYSCI